jgi:hypothetical protein
MSFQFQLSNVQYCAVLRGTDATIVLAQSQISQLPYLVIGNKATISSSGYFGYISEIDLLGTSFKVKPAQDDGIMQSVTPGLLLSGEIITITQ